MTLENRAAGDVEIATGECEVNLAPGVGQFESEQLGDEVQRIDIDERRLLDVLGVAWVACRTSPTELVLIGVGCPQAQVHALHYPHVVHFGGHARCHGGQVVGVTGVYPGAEQARAPSQRGVV